MTIQEKIDNEIQDAMRAKNVDKLAALRAVKSAIMLEATKNRITQVSDKVSLKLIARLVKQRKDSSAIFIEQNRQDLANDEISQLAYLEEYLPDQMDEQEVKQNIQEVILECGASSLSDMGRCMAVLMNRLNSKVDGSLVSRLLREELS